MRSHSWGFVLALLLISGSGAAQQPADHLTVGSSKRDVLTEVDGRLVRLVIDWVSGNFDFPAGSSAPRIAFASAKAMERLRYQGARPDAPTGEISGTVAIYVAAEQTIYLPEGWSGTSPAELSVLVHEMVHYLQNQAGTTYNCIEERERLAYAAQGEWLAMFGSDLSQEFGIDPFTMLVRSLCPV